MNRPSKNRPVKNQPVKPDVAPGPAADRARGGGVAAALRALSARVPGADPVVPSHGPGARLTAGIAAAMAFLAVLALAAFLAAGGLADRWSQTLAGTATLRLPVTAHDAGAQTVRALDILRTTPGIADARPLEATEQAALLEPWLGPDLPFDTLPLPQLIEITTGAPGPDAAALRVRLSADLPGAVYDDHAGWRVPMDAAAARLRLMAAVALALTSVVTVATVALAVQASLAANAPAIGVLRLVGARDAFILRAFVGRFTLRVACGALVGVLAARLALAVFSPAALQPDGAAFQGPGLLALLAVPLLAAAAAWLAARVTAVGVLRRLP